jgi:hypothetical protein
MVLMILNARLSCESYWSCKILQSFRGFVDLFLNVVEELLFSYREQIRGRRLPFTVGTDRHASYPEACATSVREKVLPSDYKLRRAK